MERLIGGDVELEQLERRSATIASSHRWQSGLE